MQLRIAVPDSYIHKQALRYEKSSKWQYNLVDWNIFCTECPFLSLHWHINNSLPLSPLPPDHERVALGNEEGLFVIHVTKDGEIHLRTMFSPV